MGISAIREALIGCFSPGTPLAEATLSCSMPGLSGVTRILAPYEALDYPLDQVSITAFERSSRLIDIINTPVAPWTHQGAALRQVLLSFALLQQMEWLDRILQPPPAASAPEPNHEPNRGGNACIP
jgi:hypothetical protein